MQTLTTVGYGDTPIYGFLGKLNAIFIMVVGIGSLGVLLASTSATISNISLSRRIGISGIRMKKHVIVCNYDHHAYPIVNEIMQSGVPVVVVSQSEAAGEDASEDPQLSYVKGSCLDDAVLEKAGIRKCNSVLILAGNSKSGAEDTKTDALTILMAMKAKRANPQATVTAEILDPQSVAHAESAGVDECIVRGSLTTHLISRTIAIQGFSRALTDIVSYEGDVMIDEESGQKHEGKTYVQLNLEFIAEGKFIIGLRQGNNILKDLSANTEVHCDGIIYLERKL